jgi:hypothetical protein
MTRGPALRTGLGIRSTVFALTVIAWAPGVLLPGLVRAADTVAAAPAPSAEAVPDRIAFQGFLSDSLGNAIGGVVDLSLSIHDAAAGGEALWSETQTGIAVADGLFQVELGAVSPLPGALFDHPDRWLAIRVNGGAELVPRTRLLAGPYAFHARGADLLAGAPGSSFVHVGGDVMTGPLVLDGAVLRVTGVSGDSAVSLPGDAISSPEILDEPGVANATENGVVPLASGMQSVLSRTLTPPADGYVLAMAGCYLSLAHTTGIDDRGSIGLSDDGITFAVAQDVDFTLPAALPSATYRLPAHVSTVFEARAGTPLTIHLMGDKVTGTVSMADISLNLLFVPTAYGNVVPWRAQRGAGNEEEDGAGRRSGN